MSAKLSSSTMLICNNMKMPINGFGTSLLKNEQIKDLLNAAISAGYRHLDTSLEYNNIYSIGECLEDILKTGRIKREDLFISSKLPQTANCPQYVEMYFKKCLEALRLTYVDLYLIHPVGILHGKGSHPVGPDGKLLLDYETDHIALWKEMEKLVDKGYAKAIGLSNFNIRQIQRIMDHCRIKPSNLQIEMHIYMQQKELLSFCRENKITICAYGALGSSALKQYMKKFQKDSGREDLNQLEDVTVKDIAVKYNKSPSHVLLRFLLEKGVAVITSSCNPERIKQNIDVYDFELSSDDHDRLNNLDMGKKGWSLINYFSQMKGHPEYPFDE